MSDFIKREDAIEVVCELVPIRNDAVEIADAIRAIPSADLNSEFSEWARHWFKDSAERKGEWKDRTYGGRILHPWWESCECSQCEEWGSGAWNFCPNCGARMRGTEDGR